IAYYLTVVNWIFRSYTSDSLRRNRVTWQPHVCKCHRAQRDRPTRPLEHEDDWSLATVRRGREFADVLDEVNHHLFVVSRKPAKLVVFDTETGKQIGAWDTADIPMAWHSILCTNASMYLEPMAISPCISSAMRITMNSRQRCPAGLAQKPACWCPN